MKPSKSTSPHLLALFAGALSVSSFVVVSGCMPKAEQQLPPKPFRDDFSRTTLGDDYKKQGGTWAVENGGLHSTGDHNIPLWLNVPLAKNTRVEFTTTSNSPQVDTKIEIYGDGTRHESGYIVILGGWNNKISTIARLDEHEKTRVEKRTKFEMGKTYRWRVERTNGKTLSFFVDDELIVAYDDSAPLFGPKNNKLGFTNWESDVTYDDLVITPLPD